MGGETHWICNDFLTMTHAEKEELGLPVTADGEGCKAKRSISDRRARKTPWTHVLYPLAALALFFYLEPQPLSMFKQGAQHALASLNDSLSHGAVPNSAPVPLPTSVDISNVEIGEIAWQACPETIDSSKFDCGVLAAPLDYHSKTDSRKASIYVVRYKARDPAMRETLTPREDVLGTILLNPGGPGGSGVEFITEKLSPTLNTAEVLNAMTRGRYDYLSFDPRGVGRTWPNASCYASKADECLSTVVSSSLGWVHSLPGGERAHLGELLAEIELQGAVCAGNKVTNDTLRFVGTTAVARDMRLLYRAVGDSALNYWGFSYGTVLGMTFADMFPDEVGHAVIDAVVNATDYYKGKWASTMLDTDETYYRFISECAAAGDDCALARGLKVDHDAEAEPHDQHTAREVEDQGSSSSGKEALRHHKHGALAELVHDKISGLLDALLKQPMVVANATHPGLLTWSMVKTAIFQNLYAPTTWNRLAGYLQGIIDGDGAPFYERHGLAPCKGSADDEGLAVWAIGCGDVAKHYDKPTVGDFRRLLKQHEKNSQVFGSAISLTVGMQCQGAWPIASNEPYRGNFTAQTKSPMLFFGNAYDPITPRANAEYFAQRFPGARFVLREGYGHSSLSQQSRCIEKVVSDYFVDGKLPRHGFVCPVDTWDQPVFHADEVRAQLRAAVAEISLDDGGASFLLGEAAERIAAMAFGGGRLV